MSLHLVFSAAGWAACQPRARISDAVVVLGDGVYLASQEQPRAFQVLAEDAEIRGIRSHKSHMLITYEALVQLCADHQPVISWNN